MSRAAELPYVRRRGARVALYLVLAAAGAVTGVAGALLQGAWHYGGLALALVAAIGVFHGGALLCGTKLGAAAPGAAWTVVVLLLTTSRPEGDFVFAAGAGSYAFLFGGILAAVICATLALSPPPEQPSRWGGH
ncbi:DUF6113 family protein [Streptomyces sulphureus]|uniref:DUF6113 family protein n=1 Tax=Streptomyces sulphureus TaxID=47758 RepID=UPI00047820BC|nr:DUF6113 family protein [Streptomyces sulphureus]